MHLCRFAGNLQCMRVTLGIDERGVLTTLYTQFLDVNLTGLDLRLDTEAVALYQQMAVLKDHRISAIDKILGGFAETAAGIDIAADGTSTLLSKQRLEISMLTNQFVAGREVEDDICTREGEIIAGRNRCPHILADLHTELHTTAGDEEFGLCTHGETAACKEEGRRIQILGRGKPTLLVELGIVGQIGLGDDTQQLSTLDHSGTVIQQTIDDHRQTYDRDDIEFTCEIKQCDDGALGTIQQELLLEEILARVSRDTEFREDDHLHPTTFGLGDDTLYLLDVVIHISHLHGGNGSGHFYKSVFHNFTFWMSFSMSV